MGLLGHGRCQLALALVLRRLLLVPDDRPIASRTLRAVSDSGCVLPRFNPFLNADHLLDDALLDGLLDFVFVSCL
jgi:hypothetical protein